MIFAINLFHMHHNVEIMRLLQDLDMEGELSLATTVAMQDLDMEGELSLGTTVAIFKYSSGVILATDSGQSIIEKNWLGFRTTRLLGKLLNLFFSSLKINVNLLFRCTWREIETCSSQHCGSNGWQ